MDKMSFEQMQNLQTADGITSEELARVSVDNGAEIKELALDSVVLQKTTGDAKYDLSSISCCQGTIEMRGKA